jgi:signal transduction histidine kinase
MNGRLPSCQGPGLWGAKAAQGLLLRISAGVLARLTLDLLPLAFRVDRIAPISMEVRPGPDPDLRIAALPFALVALVGQLSVAWPHGPARVECFWLSTFLLAVSALATLLPRRFFSLRWGAWAVTYVASVAFLMLAAGGIDTGLGSLLMIPVVGVALYGRRQESAVVVAAVILALLSVSLAGPHLAASTARRVVLFGSIAATLSVSVHVLRERLVQSNLRTKRLLDQAEAINAAARRLASLLDPQAITTLGTELAAQIAAPPGTDMRRALYFRIEEELVLVDSEFHDDGPPMLGHWSLEDDPPLKEAVLSRRPVTARIEPATVGPALWTVIKATEVTHGTWVPVCPDGSLHGVLAVASNVPVPDECADRCVALGHLLELALSNWSAHQMLEHQATAEERRRIARELHDGLAHELAFIASRTRRCTSVRSDDGDAGELARAADRALDEARRAITVLSSNRYQSLTSAVAQTAEDLAFRHGIGMTLDLAEGIDTPADVTENILRIVREAITNAANHGKPSRVKVGLTCDRGVRLIVEDDGCGFEVGGELESAGFGLVSMQERAALIGADFSVYSTSSSGTRIEVVLP